MSQTLSSDRKSPEDPSSLRDIRKARGQSLRDISDRTGIHKSQLSRFERGEGGLSLNALHRLARALGNSDLADQLAPYVRERAS